MGGGGQLGRVNTSMAIINPREGQRSTSPRTKGASGLTKIGYTKSSQRLQG
jgi:hypothetical protein